MKRIHVVPLCLAGLSPSPALGAIGHEDDRAPEDHAHGGGAFDMVNDGDRDWFASGVGGGARPTGRATFRR